MSLLDTLKAALVTPSVVRAGKVLAAAVVAAAAAFVAGPHFADVVGTQYAVILAFLLTPILSGVEKTLTTRRQARLSRSK